MKKAKPKIREKSEKKDEKKRKQKGRRKKKDENKRGGYMKHRSSQQPSFREHDLRWG